MPPAATAAGRDSFVAEPIDFDLVEFYQLLTYTGDVDLNVKPEEWQNFYNYHRPHSALAGKTPYEMLREKLNLNVAVAKVE